MGAGVGRAGEGRGAGAEEVGCGTLAVARVSKLLARARNNLRGVRYSDLLALVAAAGFVPIRQRGGSHQRFVQPEAEAYLNLQPLRDGGAKDYQVIQVLRAIDEYGLLGEDEV